MEDLKLSTMISEQDIADKVAQMGETLTHELQGKDVVAVCILRGSFIFYADLIRKIDLDITCDFISVSSYAGSRSSGEVKMTLDLNQAVEGRHVLIIEDIVDSGLTMKYLQQVLKTRNPASITTVALLHKPTAEKVKCELDHVGFEIADDFVVGYGLDYQGQCRHLPYIARVHNIN